MTGNRALFTALKIRTNIWRHLWITFEICNSKRRKFPLVQEVQTTSSAHQSNQTEVPAVGSSIVQSCVAFTIEIMFKVITKKFQQHYFSMNLTLNFKVPAWCVSPIGISSSSKQVGDDTGWAVHGRMGQCSSLVSVRLLDFCLRHQQFHHFLKP